MPDAPILLVEDNPDTVVLTQRALRKASIRNEVVVAIDGQEALDYLFADGRFADRDRDELPAFVLLDLKLPKVDGLQVLERLRANPRTRRIPVVMLTSSTHESDVLRSYDLHVNSYIRKPVDYDEFVETVGRLGLYWLRVNERPPLPPRRTSGGGAKRAADAG